MRSARGANVRNAKEFIIKCVMQCIFWFKDNDIDVFQTLTHFFAKFNNLQSSSNVEGIKEP
jgi:hypothetical protein